MKNFNWNELVAVHCNTEEKSNDFLKGAYEHGFNARDYYKVYGKETCYDITAEKKIIMFASLSYYKKNGYKIIEWEIDNMKEFTEKDLAVGMLVETRGGVRAIIMPKDGGGLALSYKDVGWDRITFNRDFGVSITKVWSPCCCLDFTDKYRKLIWEYKEAEEMTLEAVCKELGRNIKIIK